MTKHQVVIGNSREMSSIKNKSVQLIVTSPPYPMIEMWDEQFGRQDPTIIDYLNSGEGINAFYAMHKLLNNVWDECDRVLQDNGFVCINIGDATRTINGEFQLFSNHTQIINYFLGKGYSVLPDIHWRKQSNAPNKFMGSGMYPAGAYVTYEHEYILVFRKGGKRIFDGNSRKLRQKSAYFWEERNVWFSDLWDIKGANQAIATAKTTRERNASFPFEIPFRLVNMYSAEGDTILDPFTGLGTTNLACVVAQRNSIGYEIDPGIAMLAIENINCSPDQLNSIIDERLLKHRLFIDALPPEKQAKCYDNLHHSFKVKTKQEIEIQIDHIDSVFVADNTVMCNYK